MARKANIDIKYPIFKTVEMISVIVGIGENRIRQMITNREIEYIECGNKELLRIESFDDWFTNNKVTAVIKEGVYMSIATYKVKNKVDGNGSKTGRPGDMYIVKLQYMESGERRHYAKRGFATKKDAQAHESYMREKFANPAYSKQEEEKGNMILTDYLDYWVRELTEDRKASTVEGYVSHIKSKITPLIGHIKLTQITPRYLDNYFQMLLKDKNYANNTVRNVRNPNASLRRKPYSPVNTERFRVYSNKRA